MKRVLWAVLLLLFGNVLCFGQSRAIGGVDVYDTSLTPGNCVTAATNGKLASTNAPCYSTGNTGELASYNFDVTGVSGLTVSGAPSLATDQVYTLPNSVHFSTGTNAYSTAITPSSPLYWRGYLHVNTAPSTGGAFDKFIDIFNNGVELFGLYLTPALNLQYTNVVAGTTGPTTGTITLGAWVYVEFYWVADPTNGSFIVRLNGTTVYTATGVNTGSLPATAIKFGQVSVATGWDTNMDNIDASGAGWLGSIASRSVTAVNSTSPDATGNVVIPIVKTVNSTSPDPSGNVNVTAGVLGTSGVSITEDFLSGSSTNSASIGLYGWVFATISSAPTLSATASTWNHPGIETMTTAATSGAGGSFYLGALGNFALGANGSWSSQWVASISSVSTIASRIGFMSSGLTTKIPNSGLYFRYDTSLSDTAWMACSTNTGTETCTSTGVTPVAGTFYDFYISSTTAGTISYAINTGAAVTICASGCTVAGTPSTGNIAPSFNIITLAASAVNTGVDYFNLNVSGLTR